MVRLQTLDLRIGVRVPASQPIKVDILRNSLRSKPRLMKTLAFASLLSLSVFASFGQDSSGSRDKVSPAVDEALRARVNKFYDAFIAGKFKEAYLLVADDSQDKFFEMSKDQYKSCDIIKIQYTENVTKATVVTSCKTDWRWHGAVTLTTFPLTSTWELVDGQWFWHFVKPTMVPSPFSPTGFVPVPPDSDTNNADLIPKDIAAAGRGILSKIGIDRSSVRLLSNQRSLDVVHLRNDMPGEVHVKVDPLNTPGLKVSLGQTKLAAHEQTTILFEWSPDDPAIKCRECALRTNARTTVNVRIDPTGQVFPITVLLDNGSQGGNPFSPQPSAPQK
jgi:hypothetical protein